ncbi:tripartite tricarboxylate transporter substrate binding protein [Oceanispirochaeta crateris]|uniref:Tripartite tricarboxylate transporter substrate binding protein n=1 Tax=Oceanispirochaeta crateris TaxID=2518645 RepID=A0A5C1QNM0_9SPIO|nr:tripartite tricarboxylate transporter substrate binding protein [Oceanispirochaeta crateris]QEN08166.1 tripartite tricarboxylate transporter substrate binding protein [Oceanispirochaeta crateris]
MKKILLVLCFVALTFPLIAEGAQEEGVYPSKDVKVIIPWSVGGMTDVLTRPITSWLEDDLGVNFIVENKPGGGGVVGSLLIENSPTDGYTIGTTSMSTISAKYISPVYPDIDNVELISQVITIPATVTVKADSPWNTIEEYVAYAKANPGKVKNSNSGNGASAHIYAEIFAAEAGIELNHIPYPGYAEGVTALLGGHVDSTNIPLPDVAQHIESGDLRLLAIASAERHPDYPDVPTLKEKGFDIVLGNYSGFVAPKGMDPEQIKILDEAIGRCLADPEIQSFLLGAGYQPLYSDRMEFADVVNSAEAQLEYLVNDLGVEFVDD